MKKFIDKWFPGDLVSARKHELDLHECVNQYSDKSFTDRETYILALEYLDTKIDSLFSESVSLKTAYSFLLDPDKCSQEKFWGPGIERLKQVRDKLWEELLNGA